MPRLASFHLATFPRRRSISKMVTLPAERWEIASAPGCRFGKVLGTSAAGTTRISADLGRWAIFAVWEDEAAYRAFADHAELFARWRSSAVSLDSFLLAPLASRGTWGGVAPFDSPEPRASVVAEAPRTPSVGRAAVLTRASVRWTKFVRFACAIRPVDDVLRTQPGCELALGVGEWPVGQQATFSIWSDTDAIEAFAYKSDEHKEVIRRTYRENWYSEEMFSRFAVLEG